MATITRSDYNKSNSASVGTLSDGSSFSGLNKVQPVHATFGNASSGTGSGDAEFTITVSSQDEIVVVEPGGTTTKAYEVAVFDTANDVVWLWIYGSWNSDGSDQAEILAGGGDGTDYSSPRNASGTNGTGLNPWGETGILCRLAAHYNGVDSDTGTNDTAFDSSPDAINGTVNGGIGGTGQFEDGVDVQTDDYVDFNESSTSQFYPTSITVVGWNNPDDVTIDPATIAGNNDNQNGWYLRNRADQANFLIGDGSSYTGSGTTASFMTTGTYYQTIGQFDDAAGSVEVHVDGDSYNSTAAASNLSSGSTSMWAGQHPVFGNNYDGQLDELRVYAEYKSATWRLADFDASPKGGQTFFSWGGQESVTVATLLTLTEAVSIAEIATKKINVELTESAVVADILSRSQLLNGVVELDGTAVQGATVYSYNLTKGHFIGKTTTDANGEYEFQDTIQEGDTVLVAVDYEENGNRYGDEKSTVI